MGFLAKKEGLAKLFGLHKHFIDVEVYYRMKKLFVSLVLRYRKPKPSSRVMEFVEVSCCIVLFALGNLRRFQ